MLLSVQAEVDQAKAKSETSSPAETRELEAQIHSMSTRITELESRVRAAQQAQRMSQPTVPSAKYAGHTAANVLAPNLNHQLWAPTAYKWGYNPYKWGTGVISPL